MLMICRIFLWMMLLCSISLAENITLQTYYPAPQGNYRSMRAREICVGKSCQDASVQAQQDTLFVEKGVQLGKVQGNCDTKSEGRIVYDRSQKDVVVCVYD